MGITKGCLVESEEPAIAVVAPPDRAPRVDVEPLETVDARLGLAAKTSTLLLLLGRAGSCDLHVARHRLPWTSGISRRKPRTSDGGARNLALQNHKPRTLDGDASHPRKRSRVEERERDIVRGARRSRASSRCQWPKVIEDPVQVSSWPTPEACATCLPSTKRIRTTRSSSPIPRARSTTPSRPLI